MILGGYAAIGAGAVAMFGLHVATGLDPVHTVISEYAFEPDGWLLPVSLTFFAAGAAAFGTALFRRGEDRGAALLVGIWGLCMLLIGAFPTDEPGVPLSMSGGIHRYAAFVAFLTMPVAGLILARRHAASRHARPVRLLSLACLGVLVLVVLPYVVRMAGIDLTNDDIPAGVTQRMVVVLEVAVLALLGMVAAAGYGRGRGRRPVLAAARPPRLHRDRRRVAGPAGDARGARTALGRRRGERAGRVRVCRRAPVRSRLRPDPRRPRRGVHRRFPDLGDGRGRVPA
ncbi:hypothetical protein J2S55_005181 [Streptosporangium brasiliense]|uniref:DUF998 domain-containing protein n=1 Tax=Streptosporangium brasiliense TaxID=47480 RepID=A0ABT9RC01_9ACTN|nr:DUF998 domain-containing protein [Streptosporangium brasiliense]MDP9865915.1 hypothetical protein [Streptosporangium brasiliense]